MGRVVGDSQTVWAGSPEFRSCSVIDLSVFWQLLAFCGPQPPDVTPEGTTVSLFSGGPAPSWVSCGSQLQVLLCVHPASPASLVPFPLASQALSHLPAGPGPQP